MSAEDRALFLIESRANNTAYSHDIDVIDPQGLALEALVRKGDIAPRDGAARLPIQDTAELTEQGRRRLHEAMRIVARS